MRKFYVLHIFLLFFCFLSGLKGSGQTNPVTQALPYTQDFSMLGQASTVLPAGWQGWQLSASGASSSFRMTDPLSDLSVFASSSAGTATAGLHNYNGKIGLLSNANTDPALCLAIATTGKSNLWISYDVMTIRNPYDGATNTRLNELTLQFRIGMTGVFTSLPGIEYQNNTSAQTASGVSTPQNLQTRLALLPAACNNQPVVQLRWVQRDVSGIGSRPGFAVDNLAIVAGSSTAISAQSGSWSAPTTWVGGVVPSADDNVILANGHTVSVDGVVNRNPGTTTIVTNGSLLVANSTYTTNGVSIINGAFQLNTNGSGTGINFVYGPSGTLVFNDNTSVSINNNDVLWPSSGGPYHVTVLQGGFTLNSTSRTIDGTLQTAAGVALNNGTLVINGTAQIEAGGTFLNSPTYGNNATLIYNSGSNSPTGNEWTGSASTSVTAGPGIPANVTVLKTGTNVVLLGSHGVPGNINVSPGSTLTLANTSGHDLYLGGNFNNKGTVAHNGRAVYFVGASGSIQTVTGFNLTNTSPTNCFASVVVNNGTTLALGSGMAVNTNITFNQGKIKLGNYDLTVNNAAGLTGYTANSYILTNGSGRLRLPLGAGATMIFPVGNTSYNPIALKNGSTFDTYGVAETDGAVPNAQNAAKAVNRRWAITKNTTANPGIVTVTVQYNNSEEGSGFDGTLPCYMGLYNNGWTQTKAIRSGTNPYTVLSATNFTATLPSTGITAYFAIGNADAFFPTPTITSISPTTKYSGEPAFILTVTGSNFLAASQVTWNGSARPTTVVSASQLTAAIPASDLALVGTASIGVVTSGVADALNPQQLTVDYTNNPVIATAYPSTITTTSAVLGGEITYAGSSAITENGVVYTETALNPLPKLGDANATKLSYPTPGTGAFSLTTGPLGVNKQYSYRAYAFNANGVVSYGDLRNFYTAADVPLIPSFSRITSVSMDITVGSNTNPLSTEYSIQETGGLFVQADGTLGPSAVWKTANDWSAIKTIKGLTAQSPYSFAITARNGDGVSTAPSAFAGATTLQCSVPTDLAISNITNSGVAIRWNSSGTTAYQYAVTTSQAAPTGGGVVLADTSDFVTGLQSGSTYYVHLRAKCGLNTYSDWVTSDPFTTLDAPTGLITWVPTGLKGFGANPFLPTTTDSRLTVSGLTRGPGVNADTTGQVKALTNGWGGYDWSDADDDITFKLSTKAGYQLSLTGLQLSYRISATGPKKGALSFSMDNGVTFSDITTVTFVTGSTGFSLPEVKLDTITALQKVQTGKTITFRLLLQNGDAQGTWYLFNQGLVLNGSVSPIVTVPTAKTASNIQPTCFTANWDEVPGAKYYLWVSTPGDGTAFDSSLLAGWDFISGLTSNAGINKNIPISATGVGTLSLSNNTVRTTGWDGGGDKYWEIYFSTQNFRKIRVFSTQRSSGSGPRDFTLQYKVGDTGTYADVVPGAIKLGDDYTTGVITNLSLPATCDNKPRIYLRWLKVSDVAVDGGSVVPQGASNLNDIKIYGFAVMNTVYVPGYEKKDVGTAFSVPVSGLLKDTVYFYEVRSVIGTPAVTSNLSNKITVRTSNYTTADYRSKKSGIWNEPANWEYSLGCSTGWTDAPTAPGQGNNVIIQDSHTITLDAGPGSPAGVSIKNLTLQPTATCLLNGQTLTITGALSGTGKLIGSPSSSLVFDGPGGSILSLGTPLDADSKSLANLTIRKGTVILKSQLLVYNLLDVAGGMLDLSGQSMVLKSTSVSATAKVAEIKGYLLGAKNVTVERFIPAAGFRRWRLLTAPVTGTTLNESWQEGMTLNSPNHSFTGTGTATIPEPGFGTLINAHQPKTAASANGNGFDFWPEIASTFSTIRTYAGTPANGSYWTPVSSTLQPGAFDNFQAYLLFIRGDRSITTGTAVGPTILRATGTLRQGPQVIPLYGSATQSYTLIPNPYAAPIDFWAFYQENAASLLDDRYWLFDANLGSPTFPGGYKLVLGYKNGSYEVLPSPLNASGNGTTNPTYRLIHAGSAFFVEPKSVSPGSVTVKESQKSLLAPAFSVFRGTDKEVQKLYLTLSALNGPNGDTLLLDGVLARWNSRYRTHDDNIPKAVNSGENIAIAKEQQTLIVSSSPAGPEPGDTVALQLWNTSSRAYLLEVKALNILTPGLEAALIDRYTGLQTPVSLNGNVTPLSFAITTDLRSRALNRFYLVFRQSTLLPLNPINLQAAQKTGGVMVEWTTLNDGGANAYELQKSVDGQHFTKVAVIARREGATTQHYEFMDWQPGEVNYYRVRRLGTGVSDEYSRTVKVTYLQSRSIFIFPNPVRGELVQLQLVNQPAGLYTLVIYSSAGQAIATKQFRYAGGTGLETLKLVEQVAAGQYRLVLKKENGLMETKTIEIIH